jgi:hypothetical protein
VEEARDRAVVGTSTPGKHGREVGDELTGGSAGQRERVARVREERQRQTWPMGQQKRERERGCAGWHLQAGPACQSPRARRRGRGARLNGPTWAELAFLFSREFLIAFLFIFSRVLNSNSNQVSNSNQIKLVQ